VQIEIDFDVFKALTALREGESDSYNHVIRRLLKLSPPSPIDNIVRALASAPRRASAKNEGFFAGGLAAQPPKNFLATLLDGALFNGVYFPEGTQFRATYKGRTFVAQIKDRQWIGEDGVVRSSPSDAASAISGTNVNGWRFWHALRPGDVEWVRMDELRP
jgi:hypothetical protein